MQLLIAALLIGGFAAVTVTAQQPDQAAILRGVDASVQNRIDRIAEYSVTEHYAVFRGGDEVHPAAEMMVKTVFRKEQGKSYTILSESGSSLLRSQVLGHILETEKQMSQPVNRATALITTANYEMKLTSPQTQILNGRECLLLTLTPRRKSPYLYAGNLWVDAKDYSIVQLEGTAAKSPSIMTGPAQVARQYAAVNGLPMATHAKAVSNSSLLGQTIVKIDYQGYQIELSK